MVNLLRKSVIGIALCDMMLILGWLGLVTGAVASNLIPKGHNRK